jgi:hypothetical protein
MDSNEIAPKSGGYKKIKPRWKPGESGNPAGRRPSLDKVLRDGLCKRNEAGATTMEVVVTNLINGALKGDLAASIEVIRLSCMSPDQKKLFTNKKAI